MPRDFGRFSLIDVLFLYFEIYSGGGSWWGGGGGVGAV